MRYVLDTDTIIYLRKGHRQVENAIARHPADHILTTTITRAELYYGAHHSVNAQKHLALLDLLFGQLKTLPFCDASAQLFGRSKAQLRKAGSLLADMDLMIAGITLAHGYTLVSNNTRHFERVSGLRLENWLKTE